MAAVFETLPRYNPTIGKGATVLCNNEYIGTLCGMPIVKTDNLGDYTKVQMTMNLDHRS